MATIAQHIGNYDILDEIGRGGMAVVYQAYDRVQRRVVALKVLPAYLAHDPDLLRRFLREGQESVALQHPNIVRTYEAGEAEGVHYIAMEYLPGGSVAEALARQGHPFDLATTTSIVGQVASAVWTMPTIEVCCTATSSCATSFSMAVDGPCSPTSALPRWPAPRR